MFGDPAGGPPVRRASTIAIVTGVVGLVYVALAVLLWRERTGHVTLVGKFADTIGRLDGVPRWAARAGAKAAHLVGGEREREIA